MATPVVLSGIKSSQTFSQTNNTNTEAPVNLPSLESGQVITAAGNTSSAIGGVVGNNTNGVINMLDGGAIAASFDFADKSVTEVFDLTAKLLDNSQASINFAGQQAQAAISKATEQTNSNSELITKLLWAAGGIAALYLVGKYWGK